MISRRAASIQPSLTLAISAEDVLREAVERLAAYDPAFFA